MSVMKRLSFENKDAHVPFYQRLYIEPLLQFNLLNHLQIPGIQPDVIVFNITLMVACLTELSIYCYFGSELTAAVC